MVWGQLEGITAARQRLERTKKNFGTKHAEVVWPYIQLGRAYLNFGRRAEGTSKERSLNVASEIFEQCANTLSSRQQGGDSGSSAQMTLSDQKFFEQLRISAHYFRLFAADCHIQLGNLEKAESCCIEAMRDANLQHKKLGYSQHLIESLHMLAVMKSKTKDVYEACFCLKSSIELSLEALSHNKAGLARQLANAGDHLSTVLGGTKDEQRILELCALACFRDALPHLDNNEQDIARFGEGGRRGQVALQIDALISVSKGCANPQIDIHSVNDALSYLSSLAQDISFETFFQRMETFVQVEMLPKERFAASSFLTVEAELSTLSAGGVTAAGVEMNTVQHKCQLGSRVCVECPNQKGTETIGTCIDINDEVATIGLGCGSEVSILRSNAKVCESEIMLVQNYCDVTGLGAERVNALGPTLIQSLRGNPTKSAEAFTSTEVLEMCFGIIEHAQACVSLSTDIDAREYSLALEFGYWGLGLASQEGNKDTTARAFNCLGNAYDGLRMLHHAKNKYEQSLQVIESWLSAIPNRALATHANLSITLFKLGLFEAGEIHFRKGKPGIAEEAVRQHMSTTARKFHAFGSMNLRGGQSHCLCRTPGDKDPKDFLLFMGRMHQEGVLTMPGAPSPLRGGQRQVQLWGLRNKAELNGAIGKVDSFADGNLAVTLDSAPPRVVKVKPQNLRVFNAQSRFVTGCLGGGVPEDQADENQVGQQRCSSKAQQPSAKEPRHKEPIQTLQATNAAMSCKRTSSSHPEEDVLTLNREQQNKTPLATDSEASCALEHSSMTPGEPVRLQNLKQSNLNGEVGEFRAVKSDRIHVRLSNGRELLVRPEHCVGLGSTSERCAVSADASEGTASDDSAWLARYAALQQQAQLFVNVQGAKQLVVCKDSASAVREALKEFECCPGDENMEGKPGIGLLLRCLAFDCLFSLGENVQEQGLEQLALETGEQTEELLNALETHGMYALTSTSSVLRKRVQHHERQFSIGAAGESQLTGTVIDGAAFKLWAATARVTALNWMSNASYKLGDYGRSLALAETAKRFADLCESPELLQLSNPSVMHLFAGHLGMMASSDQNLARSYRRCGKVHRAIEIVKSLVDKIAAFEATGKQDAIATDTKAVALLNLGAFHYDIQAFREAAEYNKQALDLCARHPKAIAKREHFESMILGNQANALEELGLVDEAQAHRRKAILQLQPKIEERTQSQLASLARIMSAYAKSLPIGEESVAELEAAYQVAKGAEEAILIPTIVLPLAQRLHKTKRDPERAERVLLEGLDVCERMQASLGQNDALRISIFEKQQALYSQLQRLLMDADRQQDALCAAERSKARALAHLMAAETLKASDEVSWGAVQEAVRAEQCTILLYSMVEADGFEDHALMTWVLSAQGHVVQSTCTTLSTERLLQIQGIPADVHGTLARGRATAVAEEMTRGRVKVEMAQDPDTTKLQAMYDLLILPVARSLELQQTGDLLIIPHYQLFMVPWAALMDASKRYLVESFAIRLSPSLRIASAARSTSDDHRVSPSMAFVGNPWPIPASLDGLATLPFAEREVQHITAGLKQGGFSDAETRCITGQDATKDEVLRVTQGATWLHFACHGLLEERALVMAGRESSQSLLMMDEVLKLGVGMANGCTVVLSACNSGSGEICGEGVVGLARAFLGAGASAALVSLWHIPDDSTMVLMRGLYCRLRLGMSMPQATRMSMLSLARRPPRSPSPTNSVEPRASTSWTSDAGRVERLVAEKLFNHGLPFHFNGSTLAVGNGMSEDGHVAAAAFEALFGGSGDETCRVLWGYAGASRSRIACVDALVLREVLGGVRCSYRGSALCCHTRCARHRRPESGLLLLLHLLSLTAPEPSSEPSARAALTRCVCDSILLIQEQLAILQGDVGGPCEQEVGPCGVDRTPLRPKHWAPFILIGASTLFPPGEEGQPSEPQASRPDGVGH